MQSGPAWSWCLVPLPRVQLRCRSAVGIFHLTLQPAWLLLRSLSCHRQACWAGQAFLQVSAGSSTPAWTCSGRASPLQLERTEEGVRAPDTPQPNLRPRPCFRRLPAASDSASAQACFLLASCSPVSFSFPSGRLPALPKTPSRKFACCHKIMQMCSCGCPLSSSGLCLPETRGGRNGTPRCPLSS